MLESTFRKHWLVGIMWPADSFELAHEKRATDGPVLPYNMQCWSAEPWGGSGETNKTLVVVLHGIDLYLTGHWVVLYCVQTLSLGYVNDKKSNGRTTFICSVHNAVEM